MHRVLFLLTIFLISSCSDDSLVVIPVKDAEQKQTQNLELNPDRDVYFGDLHVHTKYSFDDYISVSYTHLTLPTICSV